MSRRIFLRSLVAAAALTAMSVVAGPLVVGFERFHSAKATVEGGRLLYNELGCANCHGGDTGLPPRRGPVLTGVAQRVQPDWLRSFLKEPSVARPGTAMPHLLDGKDDVEAVVHYLASLKPKTPGKPPSSKHVNAAEGRELFHTIGCVSCHQPDEVYNPEEGRPAKSDYTHVSVGFSKLTEKYSLATLADFLSNPLKVRPDGRMPRIDMELQDRIDLAGYLLGIEGSDPSVAPAIKSFTPEAAQIERGKALVTAANCAACHELPKEVIPKSLALVKFQGGCLNNTSAAGIPRYALSGVQQASLKLFLAHRDAGTPALLAGLELQALNCTACHERDGKGGPDAARKAYFQGDHNLGDTGRFPPPLTGVGRKLQPDWFAGVLGGTNRIRSYLKSRMPVYGDATTTLPALMAKADGKASRPLPEGDVESGRKLLGTLGGNSCITCHRWGDRASLGIQALDISNLSRRIQPGWLQEYLVDPATYRAGTLMPSFWPEGKAANTAILGGDTVKQIAAIYTFASKGKGDPEGFPETSTGEFELIPKDHPIVQRTFMEGVGTHTILVGFPQGVHFAYDGQHARPALAWKGRFFDAYTTWYSRFAPFEKPLGASVVKWPEWSPGETPVRFDGFRLDAQRVPVFLLDVRGVRVEERLEPVEKGLSRTLKWDASKLNSLSVVHPEGVTVTEDLGSKPGQRRFIYSWK